MIKIHPLLRWLQVGALSCLVMLPYAHAEAPAESESTLLDQVISAAKEFREVDPDKWTEINSVDMMRRLDSREPEVALEGLFQAWLTEGRLETTSLLKWYTAGRHERATRMAVIALFRSYESDAGCPLFAGEATRYEPVERREREEEIQIIEKNLKKIAGAFYKDLSENPSKSPKVKELMGHFRKAAGVEKPAPDTK